MIAKSIYIQLYKFRLSIKTEKLNIVSQVLSGVPQSRLCKEYHLGQHYLENLIDPTENMVKPA